MTLYRIAAFSQGNQGGNPAGVALYNQHLPPAEKMQALAAEVGYSETAFAAPMADGWRVRYFAPNCEVPFCGHATIALGAALANQYGDAVYPLSLNESTITVEGYHLQNRPHAALQSPVTSQQAIDPALLAEGLDLFGYQSTDLDPQIPPVIANAGATHLVMALNSREALAQMRYNQAQGADFMQKAGLVTISLVFAESPGLLHARNPFAIGGVYEDPATGAAAAALAGYLKALDWPHQGALKIRQGEDMGMPSLIEVILPEQIGGSVRVAGQIRFIVNAVSSD